MTLGESYYTLIDINNERYQFTVPVSWSVDSNTVQQYRCRIRFGGLIETGLGVFINGQQISVSVTGIHYKLHNPGLSIITLITL